MDALVIYLFESLQLERLLYSFTLVVDAFYLHSGILPKVYTMTIAFEAH